MRRAILTVLLVSLACLTLPSAAAAPEPISPSSPAAPAGSSDPVYDITTAKATYATRLRLPSDMAMQCFAIDPATGEIYAAQATASSGGDAIYYRMAPDGTVLDWQTLKGAGHMVSCGLERDGQYVYLWGMWWTPESGAARFPYRWRFVGQSYKTQILSTDPTVEAVPNLDGGLWQEYSIDQTTDLVTMRTVQVAGETSTTYFQRRLSELKAGTGSRLRSVTVPDVKATYGVLQGQTGDATYLYAAFGGGRVGESTYTQPQIVRFDWATGTPTIIPVAALNMEGGADGSYVEIEGASMHYRSPTEPEVMVGIVSHGQAWDAWLYAFRPVDAPEAWAVRAASSGKDVIIPLTDTNNFALYNVANPLRLRQVNGVVFLQGELQVLNAGFIDGTSSRTAAMIPTPYIPWALNNGAAFTQVCQGSGNNRFTLTIVAAGNLVIWRYGPGPSAPGSWLPIYTSWPTA